MKDFNYGEITNCEPRDTKTETAKSILENMDAILKELADELRRIDDADDAIYELERAFPVDDFGKIIRCISRTPENTSYY